MRKIMVVGLVLMMALSMIGASALAAPKLETTTTAGIDFSKPELEFSDPEVSGLNGMNLNFGEQTIPLGEATYDDINGQHTLRISDPNDGVTVWSVSVAMGNFETTGATDDFKGTITMHGTALEISNNPGATGCTFPTNLVIESGDANVPVLDTNGETFNMGWFDLTWEDGATTLLIEEADAVTITEEAVYVANLTWTLNVGP